MLVSGLNIHAWAHRLHIYLDMYSCIQHIYLHFTTMTLATAIKDSVILAKSKTFQLIETICLHREDTFINLGVHKLCLKSGLSSILNKQPERANTLVRGAKRPSQPHQGHLWHLKMRSKFKQKAKDTNIYVSWTRSGLATTDPSWPGLQSHPATQLGSCQNCWNSLSRR